VRRVRAMSLWLVRVRHAWQQPRLARLSLPRDRDRAYWLGRNPWSDLVISNRTVSRCHARLNFGPDGWILTDLSSTNGTRVNGWIVTRPQVVRPGDRVSFGSQTVVLTR
jgi:pSer/pThr/pTyr-binding forkhead associated (FHA) protein